MVSTTTSTISTILSSPRYSSHWTAYSSTLCITAWERREPTSRARYPLSRTMRSARSTNACPASLPSEVFLKYMVSRTLRAFLMAW